MQLVTRLFTSAQSWQSAFSADGIRVFVAGSRPGSTESRPLSGDAGVVLGTVFERHPDPAEIALPRIAQFDARSTGRIVASQGRELIDRYWGRYVAFLRETSSCRTWVLRDPIGNLPCLMTSTRGVTAFFSHMEDCARICPHRFTVDWGYVAAHVSMLTIQNGSTALSEVTELNYGECVEIHGDTLSRRFVWNPLDIARSTSIENSCTAARETYATVKSCVHAWASLYDAVLHRLSGGLDSSIVLACLKDAPNNPTVTCLNSFSHGSDTDERIFARLAADSAGCELVEVHRMPGTRLETMPSIRVSEKPLPFHRYFELVPVLDALVQRTGAAALFGGSVGDQVFFQWPAAAAAADCLRHHKLSLRSLHAVVDAAQLERVSVWKMLSMALRDGLVTYEWDPLRHCFNGQKLVSAAVVESLKRERWLYVHPWFRSPPNMPLGKLWQAYLVTDPLTFYAPFEQSGHLEPVTPLNSQPLVELSLRIPTYLCISDGRDRAVARSAFAHDIPQKIIGRRSKGGIDDYFRETLWRNIRFVRQMLLDGTLAQQKILDRAHVEEALSGSPTKNARSIADLWTLITTEMWLNGWQTAARAASAQ